TFFEMLGNFSFGEYFKEDAIAFAWEFVTSKDFLGLDPDRLRVTVHYTDDEARAHWRAIAGLPDSRIYSLGDKDNFWQMGDTGPCGPCSEIYVDLRGDGKAGGREELSQAEFEELAESGEFLEIWNLVFMQFDRSADGTLTPLPRPSVDTGAGLERIASVLQNTGDNFHTDLFLPLLEKVGELVGAPYPGSMDGPGASYRVLADHARAVAFLLTDGVYPSNEGRGYVLRRILRRAVRHAWLLGRREPTLALLTDTVVDLMQEAYPDLAAKREFIRDVTTQEENRFLETIEGGLSRLEEIFASGAKNIPGDEAFRLYDTFGFPLDLTQLIAAERGVAVDTEGFETALGEQRTRSREARKASTGPLVQTTGKKKAWKSLKRGRQKFVGYETTQAETDILGFRQDQDRVDLLLHRNPFYAESGGQVSDIGAIEGPGWSLPIDTVRKDERGTVGTGTLAGFEPADVNALVDTPRRRNIERNHSATHLVHWALRRHLGTHVRQQGSLVDGHRLRFDFSHHGPIEPEMLERIERDVNEHIWENHRVDTREMRYNDALALGAMAFFSEKYGDLVRVVTMGPSIELCGGTHVRSTGALGLFRFTGQGGVAAGVRRLEAVTGPGAYAVVDQLEARLDEVATALKSQPEHITRRVETLIAERAKLEARLAEALKSGGGSVSGQKMLEVDGVQVTVAETQSEDRDELGQVADQFRSGRDRSVLVLFGVAGRGAVHVALTDDLVRQGRKAGDLVNRIAAVSGGRGGGRPQFASAGAGDPSRLGAARDATPALVEEWLTAQ
ncbi:MAG TPA: alanine--tRNA ligase, partial [Gemmatimonadales bacterium]|nr:alanine--tRNA ligase [Gemmatimonadales bacterium]